MVWLSLGCRSRCEVQTLWKHFPFYATFALRISDSDTDPWAALLLKNASSSYVSNRRTACNFLCFLSSCKVGPSTWRILGREFLFLILEFESKVTLSLVFGLKRIEFVAFVFVSSAASVSCWLVVVSSSVVPDWWKVMSYSISNQLNSQGAKFFIRPWLLIVVLDWLLSSVFK